MQTREAKIQNITNTDNLSSPIQLPVFWIKANNTNQFIQTKCQSSWKMYMKKGYNIFFFKMNEKKRDKKLSNKKTAKLESVLCSWQFHFTHDMFR